MKMYRDEFAALAALTEEQLFQKIGTEVIAHSLNATSPAPEEVEFEGRQWFKENRKRLQSSICGHELVREYLSQPSDPVRIQMLAALADLLTEFKLGVSPVTLTVLIVRYGLTEFCVAEPNE